MSVASEITRKAKSNLAFALKILPRGLRDDMVVFYAFCRIMDDLADDPAIAPDERAISLELWKNGVIHGFENPTDFQLELLSLRNRHEIPNELFVAIIEGCQMDLQAQRFANWDELSHYIWRVACAVGLVSIQILGCKDPESERYAIALGRALQLTNILRDVGEDLSNGGRIYLPLADLARFNYTEDDLVARVWDERFIALMNDQASKAERFYHEAAAALSEGDRHCLLSAEIMGEIYHALLDQMREGRFKVFTKRYRVSKAYKAAILMKHLAQAI
jgi:phytoene synthase